jgi:hypothetical protein
VNATHIHNHAVTTYRGCISFDTGMIGAIASSNVMVPMISVRRVRSAEPAPIPSSATAPTPTPMPAPAQATITFHGSVASTAGISAGAMAQP